MGEVQIMSVYFYQTDFKAFLILVKFK